MSRPLFVFMIILGLSMLPIACGSSHHSYRDDYNYRAHYDRDDLRKMAKDLEEAADDLEDEAKDDLDHDSEAEDYALDAFDDLKDEAEDFKSELKDEDDLEGTEDDFQALMKSYQRAREALHAVRADDDVHEEFDKVSAILTEIGRAYGF